MMGDAYRYSPLTARIRREQMIWIVGDDNRDRRSKPFVNYLLIVINIVVFFAIQDCGTNRAIVRQYAAVPIEIVSGTDLITNQSVQTDSRTGKEFLIPQLDESPKPIYLTLISSLFLHGGLLHLLGNMLFLFVFGDNIEDRLGRLRYLLFYLGCGICATGAHVTVVYLTQGNVYIPLIGASGAISGVLGAYVCLYPRKKVKLWFWFLIFISFVREVPAFVVIGIWFLLQVINGFVGFGTNGGVAYGAHIGGFLAGLLFIVPFRKRRSA